MSNSFSDSTNNAVQSADSIEDLLGLDYGVPGLPALPPTGQYNVPIGEATTIFRTSKFIRRDCGRRGCFNSGFDDTLRSVNIFGSFRIEKETTTTTTPVFTRYADGSIRSQGTIVEINDFLYLYEDFPQFGNPGSRFRLAGATRTISFITFDPGTAFEDKQSTVIVSYLSATFTPPRQPIPPDDDDDNDDDDDDDDEIPPPCDIPITSDFDSGYFCMTFEEYNRFINDIDRVEENLRRFQE